jgi:hypothetical protein
VQLTVYLKGTLKNYGYHFDLQSNKDILIQTALLNAGFGAVGSMQTPLPTRVNS